MPPIDNNTVGNNYNVRQNYNNNNFGGFDDGSFINGFEEPFFQYQTNDTYVPSNNGNTQDTKNESKLAKFAAQQNGTKNANSQFSKYTVQPGDSVYKILLNSGYTKKEIAEQGLVDKVARSSGLQNPNLLRPGQNLNIPPVKGGTMATVDVKADENPPIITTENTPISTNITPRPLEELPALDVGTIATVDVKADEDPPIITTENTPVSTNITPRPLEELPALDVGTIATVNIKADDEK